MKKNYLYLLTTLIFTISYGQNRSDENKAKIASVFENYFNLEREAIHLHLNKTIFLNNETIWFKGYVINRKNSKPFITTNVFILLLDEKGNQVSEQLVYANNGIFSGKIELKSDISSGNYYIQAYTNWMNNFTEDESTISKINIINPKEGIVSYNKVNPATLKININPEGGNFIANIENTIGISFLDCRNNSIKDSEGQLQTLTGEVLRTFYLNQFGFGKVNVPPTSEKLKIVFYHNGEKFEKDLPPLQQVGLAMTVNNITNEDKTFINIQTNTSTLKNITGKKLYLLISKDQKLIVEEFSFEGQTKKAFTIKNENFFRGINTLRIIDNELNLLSERLIYSDSIKTNDKTTITILKNKMDKEQISFVGYNGLSNSSLSLSTLPEQTKSIDFNKTNINVGLNINPYLKYPLENPSYYFKDKDRVKKIELDLLLLNQNEFKYSWQNMTNNPPLPKYSFDIGLSIDGTVNDQIKNETEYKVKLLSYIDFINKQTDVTENGKFKIENLIVIDSSYLSLSLVKSPTFKEIKTNLNTKILNRNKPFQKPFKLKTYCETFENETISYEYPDFSSKSIKLNEVEIKHKRPELTYRRKVENLMLEGHKIDQRYAALSLLQFIRNSGFIVYEDKTQLRITTRMPNTINGGESEPEINIDGIRVINFNELYTIHMTNIDEIFLSRRASPIGINNRVGIINIYTKKPEFEDRADNFKFFIEKGFSEPVSFKQEKYTDTSGTGFENFGVVGWSPHITSNEEGQFIYEISNLKRNKFYIDIEGINDNGEIIQQELVLNLD